jgi:hypothetical protein
MSQPSEISSAMLRQNAIALLFMLDEAIRSIHPEGFLSKEECAYLTGDYLVMLNNFLGRDSSESFSSLSYEEIYDRLIFYSMHGHLREMLEAAKPMIVMNALFHGVMHDIRISFIGQSHNKENLGREVKSSVCTLIDFINRTSQKEAAAGS